MKRTSLVSILAAAATGFALTSAPASAQQEPIKIGAFVSVTGPAAFLGDPELKTLQLYIEKINGEGGVLGRKLELIHYDDGSEASKANSFVKRLIESDKVDVIIGGTTTGASMAAVPVVQKAEIPFISMAAGVSIIEPVKKWVFKVAPTDRMAAERVFGDMKKRSISKIALFSETSGFGQSGRKESQAVAPKYGVKIVADESFGPKDTDMTAQLTKIKNTPDLQAVFMFGAGQGPAIATKNYRQLDISLPLYQSHGVASEEFIRLAGPAANGVRLPAAALVVADQLPDTDLQKPVVVAYEKAFKERYNTDVSTFGGHAYDAIMIVTQAMKKAASTEKAKVRDAIEQTSGFMGTSGPVSMSPKDHMGLGLTAFRMLEIKDNAFTIVD